MMTFDYEEVAGQYLTRSRYLSTMYDRGVGLLTTLALPICIIGGSVVLFGENRVQELAIELQHFLSDIDRTKIKHS